MNEHVLRDVPFPTVAFVDRQVPSDLPIQNLAAIIFSTVQPRPAPMNLLKWALTHNIPAIAIEESNQIASNNGTVNNYLLPADHLLVASEAEKKGFVSAGVPEKRIRITGWPFYHNKAVLDPSARRRIKEKLGLHPDKKTATLTLTGLNDTAGETPSVRKELLQMAVSGLPADYELSVKPHPIEKLETLMPYMRECAPEGIAIDGATDIAEVLGVTDVLFNRGVSQVAIEALTREIPVVVLSTGKRTPFHDLAPGVVAESGADVAAVIRRLTESADPMEWYAGYREQHMPYSFIAAREQTCRQIEEIARGGICADERPVQWITLALYEGWKSSRHTALKVLRNKALIAIETSVLALDRLIRCCAEREDLYVLYEVFKSDYERQVVHCLWLDQIEENRLDVEREDLELMSGFPSEINVNLFAMHCAKWANALCRSGMREEAREFVLKIEHNWGHVPEFSEVAQEGFLLLRGNVGKILLAERRLRSVFTRILNKIIR